MSETARQLIEMLTVLKDNSYSGNPLAAKDFTIIRDCKKESFDFVINQAIAYIHNPLNFLYYDTDSVKNPKQAIVQEVEE